MWATLVALASRLRALLARRRLDQDAAHECETHIELLTGRNIRAGMVPEAARIAALRQFGNVTLVREDTHWMNSVGWLESLVQDVRFAIRGLRHSPAFVAAAVMTLAIGIGVNAAVFTVTNAVLFKGFPLVAGNDRLLYVTSRGYGCCVSYPDFEDWRAQAKSFADMAAVRGVGVVLGDRAGFPEQVPRPRRSRPTRSRCSGRSRSSGAISRRRTSSRGPRRSSS